MLDFPSLVFAVAAVVATVMGTMTAYGYRVNTFAADRERSARESLVARFEVSAREADLLLQSAQEDLRHLTSITARTLPVPLSLPPDEPTEASVARTCATSCARCSAPLTTYDLFCDNCGWKVTGPRDPRP